MRNVLIDAHVHFQPAFSWPGILNAAAANFARASRSLPLPDAIRVLVLCDPVGATNFHDLAARAARGASHGNWSLDLLGAPASVVARAAEEPPIFIVPGQQIQADDGLELLALCTDYAHQDGQSIEHAAETVLANGGVAAIPWGFGKWLGKRGRHLTQLLGTPLGKRLALADNSGRLAALGEPAHFALARRSGIPIFAGTDPLPFPGQQQRIGGFGTYLQGAFSPNQPAGSVKELLEDRNRLPNTYGKTERPSAFLGNQLRMQMGKHLGKRRLS